MRNSFTGMVTEVVNTGILFVIAEILTLRKQLTMRSEFKAQSGWNDSLQGYILRGLEAIAQSVKRVTYSPADVDPDAIRAQRLAEAKDTSITLKTAWDGKSVNSDDIVMPSGINQGREVNFDPSGADPNFPQPTPELIPNDFARALLIKLDQTIVALTRLDSRSQPSTINAAESAQIQAFLNEAYGICIVKGGEAHRADIPSGVMPADEPGTFNFDGSADPPSVK